MVTVAQHAPSTGYYEKVRLAGAQARKIILANAAEYAESAGRRSLPTEPGMVVHAKSGRKVELWRYRQDRQGARSAAGSRARPISSRSSQFRYIGKDLPRVDMPLKVNGAAKYGIDTQLPTACSMPPCCTRRCRAKSRTRSTIAPPRRSKASSPCIRLPHGVAVVGDTLEATMKGKAALKVTWSDDVAGAQAQQRVARRRL